MAETDTKATDVATEDYVQARVAEMEGKLERAVREINTENQRRMDTYLAESQRRLDSVLAENKRQFETTIRWVITIGLALVVAVLLRPSIG